MRMKTSELCDRFSGTHHLQIADPIFSPFGGESCFEGSVTTVKVFEDHALIREILTEPSEGGVLVVDGGASHRCALLGFELAQSASRAGWAGILIYGCVRDSVQLRELSIGICALHAHPVSSHDKGSGDRDKLISFAGINFRTGHYLYADPDGIVVADSRLG